MATKFYLAEIPDDFPATNVKFENMTKPLLAIPAKMVDGKPTLWTCMLSTSSII